MNKFFEMASLKSKLSKSDYKVIKCMEAQLLGKEMPYDVNALVAEREGYRAQINEIEAEIAANPNMQKSGIGSLQELMAKAKARREAETNKGASVETTE